MEKLLPVATPFTDWTGVLNVLDQRNLVATATANSTRISGTKQVVLDGITSKFKMYEVLGAVMSNEALREMCKTRGIKGVSSMSKQDLVGSLLISNIYMFNGNNSVALPMSGTATTLAFGDSLTKTTAVTTKDIPIAEVMQSEGEAVSQEQTKKTKKVPIKADDEIPTATITEETVKKVKEKKNKDEEITSIKDKPLAANSEQKIEESDESKEKEKEKEKENIRITETKKMAIPKKVKTDVWNTFIGPNINAHKCLCCLKTTITNTDFHVGHVLSEANGGNLNIDNLRPVCASCNYSMGTMSMKDYVIKYGYFY